MMKHQPKMMYRNFWKWAKTNGVPAESSAGDCAALPGVRSARSASHSESGLLKASREADFLKCKGLQGPISRVEHQATQHSKPNSETTPEPSRWDRAATRTTPEPSEDNRTRCYKVAKTCLGNRNDSTSHLKAAETETSFQKLHSPPWIKPEDEKSPEKKREKIQRIS